MGEVRFFSSGPPKAARPAKVRQPKRRSRALPWVLRTYTGKGWTAYLYQPNGAGTGKVLGYCGHDDHSASEAEACGRALRTRLIELGKQMRSR